MLLFFFHLAITPFVWNIHSGGDDPRITNDDNFDPDDYDFPKTVEKYSGKSGRWSEIASLNEGRSNHFAFVFNNKIYVIGG